VGILGEVGGLQSSLFAIGAVLVGFFTRRLFYSYLISNILTKVIYFIERNF